MPEYIKREAVLNRIQELQGTDPATVGKKQFSEGFFFGLDEAEIVILQTPTADVAEVVRCKDCKHYEIGKSYTPYCNNVMNLFEEMKPDDFCSYGERRE